MTRRQAWIVGSILAIAVIALVVPYTRYVYWSGDYTVTVRIERAGDKGIARIVACALYPEHYRYATDRLGSTPAASPEYAGLLELNGLGREVGPDQNLEFPIHVRRHGKDREFPLPKRIHEMRQEKLAIRVDYVDGSMNCFIFDVPPPDQPRQIIARIP